MPGVPKVAITAVVTTANQLCGAEIHRVQPGDEQRPDGGADDGSPRGTGRPAKGRKKPVISSDTFSRSRASSIATGSDANDDRELIGDGLYRHGGLDEQAERHASRQHRRRVDHAHSERRAAEGDQGDVVDEGAAASSPMRAASGTASANTPRAQTAAPANEDDHRVADGLEQRHHGEARGRRPAR